MDILFLFEKNEKRSKPKRNKISHLDLSRAQFVHFFFLFQNKQRI